MNKLPSRQDLIVSRYLTQAKYHFSVQEKRIIYRVLQAAQAELNGKKLKGNLYEENLFGSKELTYNISDFFPEDVAVNRKSFKQSIIELAEKIIEVEDGGSWRVYHYLDSAFYDDKTRKVNLTINKDIWKAFLNFTKGFNIIDLDVAMRFDSVYTMRLYEELRNNIVPITYSIEWLRERFLLQDKYAAYKDFKKRIIQHAVDDINAISDIIVTFKENKAKKGKAIESLTFEVVKKPDWESPSDIQRKVAKRTNNASILIDKDVRGNLKMRWGFQDSEIIKNSPLIKEFTETFGIEKTLEKMDYIKEELLKRGVRNAKGYLIASFKKELEQRKEKFEQPNTIVENLASAIKSRTIK